MLRTSPNQRPEVRGLLVGMLVAHGSAEDARAAVHEAECVAPGGLYWDAVLELGRIALSPPHHRLVALDAVWHCAHQYGYRSLALAAEVRRKQRRPAHPGEAAVALGGSV